MSHSLASVPALGVCEVIFVRLKRLKPGVQFCCLNRAFIAMWFLAILAIINIALNAVLAVIASLAIRLSKERILAGFDKSNFAER